MDSYTNPYVSPESNPRSDQVNLPNEDHSVYGPYRDVRGLAKTVIILLACSGLLSLLLGVVNTLYYAALDAPDLETQISNAEPIETMMMGVGVLMVLVYLSTVISFCMWTSRMMKNTWAIKGGNAQMKPGWAVGWYFIPLANLWKPVQAVQEMRDAVFTHGKGLSLTPWWATWVISNFVSRISSKMPTDTIAELQSSSLFDAVTSPLDIASAIFALLMVKKLTNKQHEVATNKVI